ARDHLFPYTTLFRSRRRIGAHDAALVDAEGARGSLDEDADAVLQVAGEERELEEVGEARRQRRRWLLGRGAEEGGQAAGRRRPRSEEHTSELQSLTH